MEDSTYVDIEIKHNKDFYLYIVTQIVMWIIGIGGNALIFTYHHMHYRKHLDLFMSALSSFDFLLCSISVVILHSDPHHWISINICCFEQIIFTRLIIINYYFILLIFRKVGKLFHNISEIVLCVFHALIVMPAFLVCILGEGYEQTQQGSDETLLFCHVSQQHLYGIFTFSFALASFVTFMGMTIQKRYVMKRIAAPIKDGEIVQITEDPEKSDLNIVHCSSEKTVHKSGIQSSAPNVKGHSHRFIVIGVIFQTFFSGIVLYNVINGTGVHKIDFGKGLIHHLNLVLIFLLHCCATPVIYVICDRHFGKFVTTCFCYIPLSNWSTVNRLLFAIVFSLLYSRRWSSREYKSLQICFTCNLQIESGIKLGLSRIHIKRRESVPGIGIAKLKCREQNRVYSIKQKKDYLHNITGCFIIYFVFKYFFSTISKIMQVMFIW